MGLVCGTSENRRLDSRKAPEEEAPFRHGELLPGEAGGRELNALAG